MSKKSEIKTIKILGTKIGPGAVPTSKGSASRTDIKEVSKELRKASKSGLFDKITPYLYCD